MTRRRWTLSEKQMLRRLYPDHATSVIAEAIGCTVSQVNGAAARLGVAKSGAFLASDKCCRLRPGNTVGINSRFPRGHVPANKGMRRPGWAPGRMADTQFKPGRPAQVARNYRPIGSERITDGVLCRKVTDDPALYPARRWVPVHRMVWEAAHGPVPPGHIVVFRSGQKTLVSSEITLERIELISYAENMRRNSYQNRYPKEIASAIQLRGALVRQINRRST